MTKDMRSIDRKNRPAKRVRWAVLAAASAIVLAGCTSRPAEGDNSSGDRPAVEETTKREPPVIRVEGGINPIPEGWHFSAENLEASRTANTGDRDDWPNFGVPAEITIEPPPLPTEDASATEDAETPSGDPAENVPSAEAP
ncbi:hypothetical protein [Thermostilla marina]